MPVHLRHLKESNMLLSSTPSPENIRLLNGSPLTIVLDAVTGAMCFVGYEAETLRVSWLQQSPATLLDPRALRARQKDRRTLCRARRQLLLRFCPETLVHLVTERTRGHQ